MSNHFLVLLTPQQQDVKFGYMKLQTSLNYDMAIALLHPVEHLRELVKLG